jgi:hypothetical protein
MKNIQKNYSRPWTANVQPPPLSWRMKKSKRMNPDEQYIYEERLAWLNVIDREPNAEERNIAMQDVMDYRRRVAELTGPFAAAQV